MKTESSKTTQRSDPEFKRKQRPVTPPKGPPKGSVAQSASAELPSRQAKVARPEKKEQPDSSKVIGARTGYPAAKRPEDVKPPTFLTEAQESSDNQKSRRVSSLPQGGLPKKPRPAEGGSSGGQPTGKAKPVKRVVLSMSIDTEDNSRVNVGAKGYKSLSGIPIVTSIQEVLALIFQVPGLQAYYQNAFRVQTPINGQRRLEECGDHSTIYVLMPTDSD